MGQGPGGSKATVKTGGRTRPIAVPCPLTRSAIKTLRVGCSESNTSGCRRFAHHHYAVGATLLWWCVAQSEEAMPVSQSRCLVVLMSVGDADTNRLLSRCCCCCCCGSGGGGGPVRTARHMYAAHYTADRLSQCPVRAIGAAIISIITTTTSTTTFSAIPFR